MQAKKTEDSNKQVSHRPEREIEDRIFLFVMMGGMSQVASEAAVGIRMTFLAGLNNFFKSYVRIRIVDFPYVMCSVTVRTLGCL